MGAADRESVVQGLTSLRNDNARLVVAVVKERDEMKDSLSAAYSQ